jgi:hypothetical protein
MNQLQQAASDFKLKAGNYMEGGLKRLGALFLKLWAVPMVPVGVGFMLYGLITQLDSGYSLKDTFPIGVTLTILGSLLWFLAKRLDAAAYLVRYRRHQNRIVRLARERGGRLTVTEASTDAGLTVEEAEEILKRMADGGYVEIEVTDSGIIVYRFPEVLFAHEKHWSRDIESA